MHLYGSDGNDRRAASATNSFLTVVFDFFFLAFFFFFFLEPPEDAVPAWFQHVFAMRLGCYHLADFSGALPSFY